MKDLQENHYPHLAIMAVLSFIAMYTLMYSMVNTFGDVYNSINQFYMAGLMAAPMVVIELLVMRRMYHNARMNGVLIAISVLVGLAMFLGIRQQTMISDTQFLRSMIPHHSGAILMCQEANIERQDVRDLCQAIIVSQQREIDQMNAMLRRRP